MIATLKDGFEVELLENNLDDWELLEAFYDIDNGVDGKIVMVARTLFGTDGVEKLKNHLRDVNGKVSATAMGDAMQELFESVNKVKN